MQVSRKIIVKEPDLPHLQTCFSFKCLVCITFILGSLLGGHQGRLSKITRGDKVLSFKMTGLVKFMS